MTTTWPPMVPGTMEEEIGKQGRAATMSTLPLGSVCYFDEKKIDITMIMMDLMIGRIAATC